MFVLSTTTAVLIAFLAIVAYNASRRPWKSRWRPMDLERPETPPRDKKEPSTRRNYSRDHESQRLSGEREMSQHKQLYFKLHNLEYHPEVLPECRRLLHHLFSETMTEALQNPASGILSVEDFSLDAMNEFLRKKDVAVTEEWEAYLARRKTGGAREMFEDVEEAKWWLKQAAPVKYVDGAWLGHINKISTPFMLRHVTKNAWQVMSEELGDGDVTKHHVRVYRDLMTDICAGLPEADSEDFIHPRHQLNEARCWKAAIAQLLISLFPHDFLPEILGFNMAYESLPLHLLKTIKELRELRLNPYYFELHVSIDNADSGHAAIAAAAVSNFIDIVQQDEGDAVAQVAWRRVQAGYILAEGLPTTPESPSLKRRKEETLRPTRVETELLGVFAAKSPVAHKIHCNSRLKIGRHSLVEWLEPNAFADKQWQMDFLHDLSFCRPWVVRGSSKDSKLVKELSWEGRMFGSFTESEVEVLEAWINSLARVPPPKPLNKNDYFDFVDRKVPANAEHNVSPADPLTDYPAMDNAKVECAFLQPCSTTISKPLSSADLLNVNLANLFPLWFASCALLEALPSVPVRASNAFGSAIVRILRAQAGFDDEGPGVSGMDEVRRTNDGHAIGIVELGLLMCQRAGMKVPKNLREAVSIGDAEMVAFAEWMVRQSMRWHSYCDTLIGLAWAFMEIHEAVAGLAGDNALLDATRRLTLNQISTRERTGLQVCWEEICRDDKRSADFERGLTMGRAAVRNV